MPGGAYVKIPSLWIREATFSVLRAMENEAIEWLPASEVVDRVSEQLMLNHAGRYNRRGGRLQNQSARIQRTVAYSIDDSMQWERARKTVDVPGLFIDDDGNEVKRTIRNKIRIVRRIQS